MVLNCCANSPNSSCRPAGTGIAARTLREAGLRDQAKELTHRIFSGECHSYGEALCLIGEYVTITDIGDYNHNRRGKEKDNYER